MPQFEYTAVDINGKTIKGTMEVASKSQLIERVKGNGLFLTSSIDKSEIGSKSVEAKSTKIKTKVLAIFCRQFATLINAGITAVKSLDILYQQAEDKTLKESLGKIYEGVQKGESLSESFRRQGQTYPELFINMILAGESSGNLDSVLYRLADHYEREHKLNNKIKSSMIYPIVLMVITIAVVILMMVVVLPQFTQLITSGGGEIPLPTRILMGMSDFLIHYWWILIGMIALIVILWRSYTRTDKGRLWRDTKMLTMPIVGKSIKMIVTARFARTLATLLSSGIQMLPSIDITTRVVGNRLIHDKLLIAMEDIRKGISLSLSLKRISEFPPMIHNMVGVGEESGLLDDILTKTALFFDEESEAAIQRLVGLLEPTMIILMAVIIGFIVVSIYMPMFAMYSFVA